MSNIVEKLQIAEIRKKEEIQYIIREHKQELVEYY